MRLGPRGGSDEYIGMLVNAWLAQGGEARGFRIGSSYFDVGTIDGYLDAMRNLNDLRPDNAVA